MDLNFQQFDMINDLKPFHLLSFFTAFGHLVFVFSVSHVRGRRVDRQRKGTDRQRDTHN